MNVYTHPLFVNEPHKLEYPPPGVPVYSTAPPSQMQMLSPRSSVAISTPSLVARSLTSSPSSSAVPDEPEELYRTQGRADESHDLCDLLSDSYPFDTEDDDAPYYNGKRPLARRSLLPHRQAPVFVPNPHALPYLPTITRKRSRADPSNCGRMDVSWRPHHEWLRPFRAGAVARWTQGRRDYARIVVDAGPWDTSLISELAGRFIERAAEGLSDDLNCVAPFANEVYKEFRRRYGDGPAEIFAQQLRQCLLSEFRAWWLQGLPSSIYNLPRNSPCPPHASPFRQLSSALAVAEFAGDVFAYSLAAGHYLLLFINMLLDRLTILEEVYALHTIVHHAGEAMYGRLQMIDFVDKLQRRAKLIQPNASVLEHADVSAEVARLVDELTTLVNGWAKARLTPSPSECSDEVSEYSDHNPDMERYHEETAVPDVPPGLSLPSATQIIVNAPLDASEQHTDSSDSHPSTLSISDEHSSPTTPQPEQSISWAQVVKA